MPSSSCDGFSVSGDPADDMDGNSPGPPPIAVERGSGGKIFVVKVKKCKCCGESVGLNGDDLSQRGS